MKKFMRACVCISMAITLATGCIGCGKKEVSKDSVETISVWTNAGATKAYMIKKIDEWNNTVGKEKGIKIDYTVYGADYVTVYELAMENNQAPDILAISGDKRDYVLTNKIIPISDLPGGEEFIKESKSDIIDGVHRFDGKTYFVNVDANTVGLIYNVDLFKKAGIVDKEGNAKPPKTWDEVREDAKKISALSNKVYGISFPFKWASYYNWVIANPFSASFENIAKIDWDKQTYDMSNLKKPLQWLQNIKKDMTFFPGAENMDNDTQRAQFAEGNIGMYVGASWDVGVLTSQFVAKCDWDVAELPVLDINDRYLYSYSVGHSMCISKEAEKKDPEKIMEVFKFFYSPETMRADYAEGRSIPASSEFTKGVDLSDTPKQWKSFGKLTEHVRPSVPQPQLKLEGESASDLTYKVWTGTVTDLDAEIKKLNKTYTDALRKGIKDGSIKRETYDVMDKYDFKRKD